jgi:hypothetical protein
MANLCMKFCYCFLHWSMVGFFSLSFSPLPSSTMVSSSSKGEGQESSLIWVLLDPESFKLCCFNILGELGLLSSFY